METWGVPIRAYLCWPGILAAWLHCCSICRHLVADRSFTGSATTLTLATLVSFLPSPIVSPFAGAWIDRFNRGKVMIAADGLVAFSSAVLGIAFVLADTPPVELVYLALFLRGLGSIFHTRQ